MGGVASRSSSAGAAKAAAARRVYPTRIPSSASRDPSSQPAPAAPSHSPHDRSSFRANTGQRTSPHAPLASEHKDQAIQADGYDPQLGASLRKIGPVTPHPTYSPSSTASPAKSDQRPSRRNSPQASSPPTTSFPSSAGLGVSHPTTGPNSAPLFPSPNAHPSLTIVAARQRLEDEATAEFERIMHSLGRTSYDTQSNRSPGPASSDTASKATEAPSRTESKTQPQPNLRRGFLDIGTIRQMLHLRDEQGLSAEQIEQRLGLERGLVQRLGPKGVFGIAS